MDLGNSIITAVNTVIDNKKQRFDRTIQAIVSDNSDLNNLGEVKISYKGAILPAYTEIQNVKNYPKGSHVYVTIPNNDMSARKTIMGLVERLGPLTVLDQLDNYSLNGRYALEENFEVTDNFSEKNPIIGWEYRRDLSGKWEIYDKQTGVVSDENSSISNLFETIKTFALQTETLKLSTRLTTLLLPEQSNLFGADYGIELDFYFQTLDGIDSFASREEAIKALTPIKVRLNIDQINGDPYLQADQSQLILIDTSRITQEEQLKKINFFYYRKGFPQTQDNSSFIHFSNFVFETLTAIQEQEPSGNALYITTPKGKMFIPKINYNQNAIGAPSDTLALEAVVKQDSVQVENTGLTYWYERDLSYINFEYFHEQNPNIFITEEEDDGGLPEGSDMIYDFAGVGWRIISVDDNGIPFSTNSWTVARDDLAGLIDKEYKAVSFFEGEMLTATTQIKNLDTKNAFSIEVKTKEMPNGTKEYTYTLLKEVDSESEIESNIKWYFVPRDEPPILLRDFSGTGENNYYEGYKSPEGKRGRWQISLTNNCFQFDGQIMCEVYRIIKGKERVYTTLFEVYSAYVGSNIQFHNFEQVFLYDTNGKLSLVGNDDQEGDYTIAYRPVSISGNVSQVTWRVPMAFFERPQTLDEIDLKAGFYIIKNVLSLSGLKPKSKYPTIQKIFDKPINTNIRVDFKYSDNEKSYSYSRVTQFAFVKEGMDGTNGSGYYCRIVPNIDNNVTLNSFQEKGQTRTELNISPNTVILATHLKETDDTQNVSIQQKFNFLPQRLGIVDVDQMFDINKALPFFRCQIWKKNQKLIDSYKATDAASGLQSVKWELLKGSKEYLSMIDSSKCIICTLGKTVSKEDSTRPLEQWLQQPQGIKLTALYQGKEFSFTLPFVGLATSQVGNNTMPFSELRKTTMFNRLNTYPLAEYSKFYYNSNGLYDTTCGYKLSSADGVDDYYCHCNQTPVLYGDFPYNGTAAIVREKSILLNFIYDDSGHVGAKKNFIGPNQYSILFYEKKGSQPFYYYSIPLIQMLNRITDSFVTSWNGRTAVVQEQSNVVMSGRVVAGEKKTDNTFSGVILGEKDGDLGLKLYSNGAQTMFLNTSGEIEIGVDPARKILLNGIDQTINNGLIEGLNINFAKDRIEYNYLGSIPSLEDDLEQNSSRLAINMVKDNQSVFSVSENGNLQAKHLIGAYNKDMTWGIFDKDSKEPQTIDLARQYFIREDGEAGFQKIYIGSKTGHSDPQNPKSNSLDGIWISSTGFGHVLLDSTNESNYSLIDQSGSNKKGGFVLDENGCCISNQKNSSFITGTGIKTGDWNYSNNGLFNQSRTAVITEKRATLPTTVVNGVLTAQSVRPSNGVSQEHYVRMKNGDIKIFSYSRGILTGIRNDNDEWSDGYSGSISLADKDGNEITLEFSGGNLRAVY